MGQEVRENTNVLGAQDRVPSGFALMITGDHDGYLPSFHPHPCKCSRSDSQNNMDFPHQYVALGSGLDFHTHNRIHKYQQVGVLMICGYMMTRNNFV